MNIIRRLIELLLSLFGRKKPEVLPPARGDDGTSPPSPPEDVEPPDEPEDEVDDPDYDVENETDDDHTERDPLPEPDEDTVEAVLAEMEPLSEWEQRQTWLKELGYDPGPIDGRHGPKTDRAVRDFQRDHGLGVDGIWGPKTQGAVEKALKEKGKPPSPTIPPPPVIGGPKYEDMLGDVELDDEFFGSFVDLTSKSNVKDSKGRRRRKGVRKWKKLLRFCWHQTAFTWKPYRWLKANRKWSSHHKINAHICMDTDGAILLLHNFMYYLWTANSFNRDCISIEIMGNFEGLLGSGNWYKPDKFGRGRPTRIQLVRSRQLTKWLLDPEQGPADDELPKPLLEWRQAVRELGFNPLKWDNTHRQATNDRPLDCGSECWYHVVLWGADKIESLTVGPEAGKGQEIPDEWSEKPVAPPRAAAA